MPLSKSQALVSRFYDWEIRGRGWMLAPSAVDLEPPFHPFFGHHVPEPYIDDGRRETFLSSLAGLFKNNATPKNYDYPPPEYELFPFEGEDGLVAYGVIFPRHHKPRIESLEQLYVLFSHCKQPMSFELVATDTAITTNVVCRETDRHFVYSQLRAFFPEASIQETAEAIDSIVDIKRPFKTVDYGLKEEFMRPLAMAQGLDNDTYTSLFGLFEQMQKGQKAVLQILFQGTVNNWNKSILKAVTDDSYKNSFFIDAPDMPALAQEKTARTLFGVCVRLLTQADTYEGAKQLFDALNTTLIAATLSKSNSLKTLWNDDYPPEARLVDIECRETRRLGMLLNSRELATLAHFPSPSIASSKLVREVKKTKGAPDTLYGYQYVIGMNTHQGASMPVTLSLEQRLKHIHLIGATGTRKSSLMLSLISQDIKAGEGFAVLDPHGDLIENILPLIPQDRIKDVVLIDPNDRECPVAFNILSAHSEIEKEVLASDLVALFKRFSTSWGDQMNSVFANAIIAFLDNTKGGTLVDLRRFLIEKEFRERTLLSVTDPEIRYYWQKEFPLLKGGSIAPILTRLDTFLRPKLIRNMVSQDRSLNFQDLMDGKKIILVKLSEGIIGAENSFLLGAFIVSKIQQSAMARQATDAQSRTPFYLYIDEFQNFATPSMSNILTGARKYGLGMVLAHQDMQQVSKYDTELAGALIANAGTRVCFRLGDTDAKRMADGFSYFGSDDLQNLSPGEAIARVNRSEDDFSLVASSLRPTGDKGHTDEIIEHSRNQYGLVITRNETEPEQNNSDSNCTANEEPAPPKEYVSNIHIEEITIERTTAKEQTQHTYLKHLIKKTAEANGFKASLESPTPDGGRVDVLLERDGQTYAVEISNSTGATWELHNIQKCMSAGYTHIYAVIDDPTTRHAVMQLVQGLNPVPTNVLIDTSEATLQKLQERQNAPNDEKRIKGYKVKVQHVTLSADKEQIKRATLETLMQERRKK